MTPAFHRPKQRRTWSTLLYARFLCFFFLVVVVFERTAAKNERVGGGRPWDACAMRRSARGRGESAVLSATSSPWLDAVAFPRQWGGRLANSMSSARLIRSPRAACLCSFVQFRRFRFAAEATPSNVCLPLRGSVARLELLTADSPHERSSNISRLFLEQSLSQVPHNSLRTP